MSGNPQANAPQLAPSSNPALAEVQQMLAAKGMAGNPSDPFTFLHALIGMIKDSLPGCLRPLVPARRSALVVKV